MTPLHETISYPEARSTAFFFHRQVWHLLALLILVPTTWWLASPWLGEHDTGWFWLALGIPIAHQVVVWMVFRAQLGWGTLTKVFGRADMIVWGVLFLPLMIARLLSTAALAHATQGTLPLPTVLTTILAVLILIPAIYTGWSVVKYFGLLRAMVGDHFRIKYRQMPLEKRGIFKYSNNAMYSFGFLILWAIALLGQSIPALVVAGFQHAYIWVHYYCTEKPDMDIIFREEND